LRKVEDTDALKRLCHWNDYSICRCIRKLVIAGLDPAIQGNKHRRLWPRIHGSPDLRYAASGDDRT